MGEHRKYERRHSRNKPAYPFTDGDGNLVTRNRRRIVDRRADDASESASQTDGKRLSLRFRETVKEMSESSMRLVAGRDAQCDIVVGAAVVSRKHAHIGFRGNEFVLVDYSTNGTFLRFGGEKTLHVFKTEINLTWDGVISLGKPVRDGDKKSDSFLRAFRRRFESGITVPPSGASAP